MRNNYETQIYTVKITNRSEYTVVFSDLSKSGEIQLGLGQEDRNRGGSILSPVIVYDGETQSFEFEFTKYYDESDEARSIKFNNVRLTKPAGNGVYNIEKEYSFEINLK